MGIEPLLTVEAFGVFPWRYSLLAGLYKSQWISFNGRVDSFDGPSLPSFQIIHATPGLCACVDLTSHEAVVASVQLLFTC
jgi:hypothetical protein